MKKILVTGGAGFLGSWLCDRLVEQGHHVLCVDNYFTGSKKNIEHLLSNPNFEVIRQDVCFPLYVEVDEIYNLACPASPKYYQLDPIQTAKTSFLGAYNLNVQVPRSYRRQLAKSTAIQHSIHSRKPIGAM
jgi:UDP-glucuronate decarboxylase